MILLILQNLQCIEDLAKLPNVRDVRGRVSLSTRVTVKGVDEPISGLALSVPANRAPIINDLFLKSGTWFSDNHAPEIVLNESFAAAHNFRPGDRIKVLLLHKEHSLLIVGTGNSPEFVYIIPPAGGFVPDPSRLPTASGSATA